MENILLLKLNKKIFTENGRLIQNFSPCAIEKTISAFLDMKKIKLLNEITFSLDGHDENTNDAVRGKGTYIKCVDNIKYAVSKGYRVQITSCVHKYSCDDEYTGIDNLKKLIRFAERLGVYSINFKKKSKGIFDYLFISS